MHEPLPEGRRQQAGSPSYNREQKHGGSGAVEQASRWQWQWQEQWPWQEQQQVATARAKQGEGWQLMSGEGTGMRKMASASASLNLSLHALPGLRGCAGLCKIGTSDGALPGRRALGRRKPARAGETCRGGGRRAAGIHAVTCLAGRTGPARGRTARPAVYVRLSCYTAGPASAGAWG